MCDARTAIDDPASVSTETLKAYMRMVSRVQQLQLLLVDRCRSTYRL